MSDSGVLGIHARKSGRDVEYTMTAAVKEAVELVRNYGFARTAVQFFATGPQSFKLNFDANDAVELASYLGAAGVTAVIHGSYLDHPWSGSRHASIHNIKQEMTIAAELGATGVIVHLGAGAADAVTCAAVLERIDKLLSDDVKASCVLWLEINAARAGQSTFETPEKLRRLFTHIRAANINSLKVGLCVDTAHLHSCGVTLDTYEAAEEWFRALPDSVPYMLHLNDSAATGGSGKDVHEVLCRGNIWGAFNPERVDALPMESSGLVAVLDWATASNATVILERDEDGVIHDLALLRQLGYFQN